MAKKWYDVIRHALRMYANKYKYAYLYGANGEIGSRELVERLWAQYPEHFRETVTKQGKTKEDLIQHVLGRNCYDCSSFVCAVTQTNTYPHFTVTKDYASGGLHGVMSPRRTPVEGTAGSILWKPGHVALDIGHGMCIDFANEFIDMRLYDISTGNFVDDGELPWVDYTGTSNL